MSGQSSGRRQDEGYGQVGNEAILPRPAGTAHNDEIIHRLRTRADTQAAIATSVKSDFARDICEIAYKFGEPAPGAPGTLP